jgi:hypothetical protein
VPDKTILKREKIIPTVNVLNFCKKKATLPKAGSSENFQNQL